LPRATRSCIRCVLLGRHSGGAGRVPPQQFRHEHLQPEGLPTGLGCCRRLVPRVRRVHLCPRGLDRDVPRRLGR
jgi:hypothetical protein